MEAEVCGTRSEAYFGRTEFIPSAFAIKAIDFHEFQANGPSDPKKRNELRSTMYFGGVAMAAALLAGLAGASSARGETAMLDLSRAVVVTAPELTGPERKAVELLVEDVTRRSGIHWKAAAKLAGRGGSRRRGRVDLGSQGVHRSVRGVLRGQDQSKTRRGLSHSHRGGGPGCACGGQ